MDFNRNHFFLGGVLFLLLGLQFHLIDSALLTPQFTKFLAEQTDHPAATASNTVGALLGTEVPLPPKKFVPPEWLGWCLLSIGSVLSLHALALKKP